VRRARNVAVTEQAFRVPGPDGVEVEADLARLVRPGVDFAVADATALPFARVGAGADRNGSAAVSKSATATPGTSIPSVP